MNVSLVLAFCGHITSKLRVLFMIRFRFPPKIVQDSIFYYLYLFRHQHKSYRYSEYSTITFILKPSSNCVFIVVNSKVTFIAKLSSDRDIIVVTYQLAKCTRLLLKVRKKKNTRQSIYVSIFKRCAKYTKKQQVRRARSVHASSLSPNDDSAQRADSLASVSRGGQPNLEEAS